MVVKWVLWIAAISALGADTPKTVRAYVYRVVDGDTVAVVTEKSVETRIRLWGIDAPEKAQSWGENSRRALEELVGRRWVEVEVKDTDRWGRLVGVIRLDETEVNLGMVSNGHAWHYAEYAPKAERYAKAQSEAKKAKRGLWGDPKPPWQYRREQRERGRGK